MNQAEWIYSHDVANENFLDLTGFEASEYLIVVFFFFLKPQRESTFTAPTLAGAPTAEI